MLEALYRAIRGDAAPTVVSVNGRQFSDRKLIPVLEPSPEAITVSTLTALADYIHKNIDELDIAKLICHVDSPSEVRIMSALYGDFEQRKKYLVARLVDIDLPLNTWTAADMFICGILSTFADAGDRAAVLKYASSIKATLEDGISDNGITQAVTVKKGIASVENVYLPNPVTLSPHRTFLEVEQPASRFIFRARKKDGGFDFLLKDADGGAWRVAAMQSIKAWLAEKVPGLHVIA